MESKYVVLQRFGEAPGSRYVTYIMILNDREKAEALAVFLNSGNYFDSEVTVENADGSYSNEQIVNLLKRTL